MLSDPADVRAVFTGDPALLHAGEGNQILEPFLGPNSVLLLDDARHLRQRKLMLPPFHGERMQRHVETMAAAARAEVARWPRGTPFALHPHMQDVTLEVIMRVVFGERDEALRRALTTFLDLGARPVNFVRVAVAGPERIKRQRWFREAMDPVDAQIFDLVARRRREGDLAQREDVLSMLLEARDEQGGALSDQELRDELMTLLVAGHETTATALSWALERLVRMPAALARLRDGDEEYLDATVTETLRRRPVIPLVLRKLRADVEINGRVFPEGAALSPNVYLVHHRADVYPDPFAFRPERFVGVAPGTYEWIPFGGGIRRCIGASFALTEMRTVLREVVGAVDLRPARPEPEHVARRGITWTPSRGASVVAA